MTANPAIRAEPYRPSCGTEGYAFIDRWCGRCRRDEDFRNGDGDSCPIVAATMIFGEDDPEYPAEWVMSDRGPICTAWEPTDDVTPIRDPAQMEMPL